MIIDTHCHLDYFEDKEIDFIVERAKQNNVEKIITICTKISEFNNICKYPTLFPKTIYCSIGQHPCNVDNFEDTFENISKIIDDNKNIIVGIGETGLDYFHSTEAVHIQKQKEVFCLHTQISAKYNLPLIIHNRNSDDDVYEILKEAVEKLGCRGIIHCFTASEDFMQKMIELGFYISIAGIVTFKNALQLQQIVKKIPLEKLLIETDSPYLAPVPFRGKKNEPSFVKHTSEFLANHLGIPQDEFNKITTNNALKVFKLN